MSVPRFLADEDLRQDILNATLHQAKEMHFRRVNEVGLKSAPDSQVLEFAASAGLLVVSHDVNTMSAAAKQRLEDRVPMSGLFLVPQSPDTGAVAKSLVLIWSASQAEEWAGRIVYLPL